MELAKIQVTELVWHQAPSRFSVVLVGPLAGGVVCPALTVDLSRLFHTGRQIVGRANTPEMVFAPIRGQIKELMFCRNVLQIYVDEIKLEKLVEISLK